MTEPQKGPAMTTPIVNEVPKDSKQARAQCGVVPQLDNLPEGIKRAASLEDVFVLLTGEEIA
jgi:hypothetical protein